MKNFKRIFMINYKEKQLRLETDYVINRYLRNVEFADPINKEKSKFYLKYDIIVSGIPYIICINAINEGYYIPRTDDLFNGDFGNIYKLHFSGNCISYFSIIRKQNGIIESESYDFETSFIDKEDNQVRLVANHTTIEDPENELYKKYIESGLSLEKYIDFNRLEDLGLPKKEKTVAINGCKNGTHKICIKDSIGDMADDIMSELFGIEGMKSSFEGSRRRIAFAEEMPPISDIVFWKAIASVPAYMRR